MSRKIWLEVALNGGWTRKRQPLIPVTANEVIAEAVACVHAGASVIHFHAYDEETGRQNDSPEVFRQVVAGIRAQCDAIVYPTMAQHPQDPDAPIRLEPLEQLAGEGLLEWCSVDPGSVNFSLLADIAEGRAGYPYVNSEQHTRKGLELAVRYGFHPAYAIYEPGFIRLGAALFRHMPGVPMPVYRFMLTDVFAFGLPPERFALDTLVKLMEREHPGAPWMTAGRCTDISRLVEPTVQAGGHLRVGLEDAPLGTTMNNVGWVEHTVNLMQKAGGTPATAAEIRQALKTTLRNVAPPADISQKAAP